MKLAGSPVRPMASDPADRIGGGSPRLVRRVRIGRVRRHVAKVPDLGYQHGKRAMIKIKHRRTIDCVVGGFREHKDGGKIGSFSSVSTTSVVSSIS